MSADSFTKLSSGILASTVWQEPSSTRIVWITMLALADRNGYVAASIPGLAHLARVSIPEAETALAAFGAPDPYSRTPDHEGRRIEAVAGGWRLLNHGAYRARRDADDRKDYQRDWDRHHRPSGHARSKASPIQSDSPTEPRQTRPNPTQAEADTDTEAKQEQEHVRVAAPKKGTRLPCDWQPDAALADFAAGRGFTGAALAEELDRFRDYWASQPGQRGTKLDWPATFRNWLRNSRGTRHAPAHPADRRPSLVERVAAHAHRIAAAEAISDGHPLAAHDANLRPPLDGTARRIV